MNFKKFISIALLGILVQNGISSFNYDEYIKLLFKHNKTYILLGATATSTSVALYNWYKKNKLSKELDMLRSGETKKENDQKLISEITEYVNTVNLKFESEILLAKSKANLYQEEYIERWIAIAKQKRSTFESVNLAYSALASYKMSLEICILEWNKINSTEPYVIKGKDLFKELTSLESLFKDMIQSIKPQINFIDLSLLMDRDNFSEYFKELSLSKQFINQQYFIELDKIVRSKCEIGNPFPYMSYSKKLKNDIDNFKNILEKLKGTKLFIFQERIIQQASELTMALTYLLENIVSTNYYKEELAKKPEFEKQQKLLAAELKEREEKIIREKQIVETKLLNERNLEQKLANERAKIERDRLANIVQERNILYEIERLRSGQVLQEELAKEKLKNESYLKSEIEKAKSEAQKDLALKEQELANIRYQIQSLDYQKRQTDSRLNDVYRNIAICKQHIQNLQSKLNTPPCNPEAVDGLSTYLATLKDLANNASKAV